MGENEQPDQTTTEPTQTAPPETAPDNGGTKPEPQGDPAWLPARLDRAKSAAVNELLTALGVDDVATLKATLADAAKLREQQMTEDEKRTKALDAERKKREAAEKQLADLQAQQRQDRINAAIRAEATRLRAEHPEDVISWAREHKDVSTLLGDDDTVNAEAVAQVVKDAREDRPKWFVGTGPGSPSNNDGRAPQPDVVANKRASAAMQRRAQNQF